LEKVSNYLEGIKKPYFSINKRTLSHLF